MPLSYTEELVSEYYKHITNDTSHPKYVVSEKVKYKGPKGIGWSDIDVLAIGTDEICIVETKHYTYKQMKINIVKKLQKSLAAAERYIKTQPYSHGKKLKKVFVATYVSNPIIIGLQQKGIEVHRLRELVKGLLLILRTKIYPNWPLKKNKGGIGKEESNVTRCLILLLEEGFIENVELDN